MKIQRVYTSLWKKDLSRTTYTTYISSPWINKISNTHIQIAKVNAKGISDSILKTWKYISSYIARCNVPQFELLSTFFVIVLSIGTFTRTINGESNFQALNFIILLWIINFLRGKYFFYYYQKLGVFASYSVPQFNCSQQNNKI